MKDVFIIFKKELKRFFTDKRMLLTLLMPGLLIYIVYSIMGGFMGDIINGEIIPALDYVGVGFENKTVYLPSLLMSAEASKVAFDAVKEEVSSSSQNKGVFVLATVKGDIHDIGKNIVKLLLENYGYKVIDLGRDVEPKFIVDAVVKYQAPMVGLSALMTTTVPYMQQTVKLIKELAPWCKTIVGGAVLTEDYAKSIGADKYCKDAMEAVRYAEIVTNK